MITNEGESMVYLACDIQSMLSLGKTKTYEFLETVYRSGGPFKVIKIGRIYRIPKNSFDEWFEKAEK